MFPPGCVQSYPYVSQLYFEVASMIVVSMWYMWLACGPKLSFVFIGNTPHKMYTGQILANSHAHINISLTVYIYIQ